MTEAAPEADTVSDKKSGSGAEAIFGWIERHWLLVTLALWVLMSAWLIWSKWLRIQYLGLSDTDDNLRLAQVRALLEGQSWFDLRQHRMNWPDGLNVHWSRLVDLPIAGLILALKPFVGAFWAERWAVAIAPLLPLGILMTSLSLTARRMIGQAAYPLALFVLLTAGMVMNMFQPLRIDHHGWQIASLGLLIWGLVDSKRMRGGMIAGGATALSLIIGLEMLPYLALAGVAIVLRWIVDREENEALTGYAVALGLGTSVGFALFTSNDNRMAMCDALSPVWFSTALMASGLLGLFGFMRIDDWRWRLALATAAGLAIASFFSGTWPQCLGRPENVPPELDRVWLSNVREAKPIFAQGWKLQMTTLAVPVLGVIGLMLEFWTHRRDRRKTKDWAMIAMLPLVALALLFWQTRAGPAAQMLGVIGITALAWRFGGRFKILLVLIMVAGAMIQAGVSLVRDPPPTAEGKLRAAANAQCPTISNMKLLNRLPPGKMLTFVDLGPRLIVTTHHDGVTGPYHRNVQAILDIHHFFDRDEANAREIVDRRAIDYVMICPNLNESTLYKSRSPKGFYMTLAYGKPPAWLETVPLPKWAPYRVWKVRR